MLEPTGSVQRCASELLPGFGATARAKQSLVRQVLETVRVEQTTSGDPSAWQKTSLPPLGDHWYGEKAVALPHGRPGAAECAPISRSVEYANWATASVGAIPAALPPAGGNRLGVASRIRDLVPRSRGDLQWRRRRRGPGSAKSPSGTVEAARPRLTHIPALALPDCRGTAARVAHPRVPEPDFATRTAHLLSTSPIDRKRGEQGQKVPRLRRSDRVIGRVLRQRAAPLRMCPDTSGPRSHPSRPLACLYSEGPRNWACEAGTIPATPSSDTAETDRGRPHEPRRDLHGDAPKGSGVRNDADPNRLRRSWADHGGKSGRR